MTILCWPARTRLPADALPDVSRPGIAKLDPMRLRSTLIYTVLRLAFFAIPFGLMMLLPIFQDFYWLAAIFAALIGLSLSLLFLRRPLDAMTSDIADTRASRKPRMNVTDEEAEDAQL